MEELGGGLGLDRVQETLHPPGGATQALLQLETVYGPLASTTHDEPEQLYLVGGGGGEHDPPQLGSVVVPPASSRLQELLIHLYFGVTPGGE